MLSVNSATKIRSNGAEAFDTKKILRVESEAHDYILNI